MIQVFERIHIQRLKGDGKWILVYKEAFETKVEAKERENQLKSSRWRYFIKEKILGR